LQPAEKTQLWLANSGAPLKPLTTCVVSRKQREKTNLWGNRLEYLPSAGTERAGKRWGNPPTQSCSDPVRGNKFYFI